jgi:hypothetical protein
MNWLKVLSPCCRDAARMLSESMDRRLTLPERVGLRVHLLLCSLCRRYGRQLVFLRKLVGAFARIVEAQGASSASEMSPEARARIRERLERSRRGE